MAIPSVDVNLVFVLIAGVAAFILGGLWYSPIFFGNAWMKSAGLSKKDIDKHKSREMARAYITSFLMSLITAYVLAYLIKYIGAVTWIDGLIVAFGVWLGFIATVSTGVVLWEGKPLKFYFINVLYHLVSLILMAEILVFWG